MTDDVSVCPDVSPQGQLLAEPALESRKALANAHYRPDIDGLRALAVLPVMLYHAGIHFFGGGFVGVDVFFVISGFLITSILLKDLSADKFSLATFYERRGRRILPALTAVVLFCVAGSFWLSMSSAFRSFSRSVLWLSFFSSNILFKSEFGYFDADAHTKPLLHTWSLSVEEQFYLFFPILLFLGWRYARKHIGKLVAALAVISLTASYFGLKHDPSATFYYIHFRAWELALGCLLALASHRGVNFRLPELPRAFSEILSAVGVTGILIPVFFYSRQTAFPGLAALPVCLGTFLLVWTNTKTQTLVGRLLSARPAVGIGLISYSLYLWHWPLLVFGKLYKGEDLTAWQGAFVLALSFPLSWASWRFIERPVREKRLLRTRRRVLACSLAALVVTGSMGFAFSRENNAIYRRLAGSRLLEDPRPLEYNFPDAKSWQALDGISVYTLGDVNKPGMLVIGDSFADHWITGLAKLHDESGITIHVQPMPSCLPLVDTYVPEVESRYKLPARKRNTSFELIIERTHAKHVVLAGSWKPYIDPAVELDEMHVLYINGRRAADLPQQRRLISEQLEATIRLCNRKGCKVWVLIPPPDYPYDVPLKLASLARSRQPLSKSFMPRKDALNRRRATYRLLANVVAKHETSDAELLDPFGYFCEGKVCVTVDGGRPLYTDDAHLSYYGSIRGSPVFEPIAEELKRSQRQ